MSVDTNKQRLGRMLELVGVGLGPYVEQALEAHYGKNWRQHAQFPDTVARGGRLDVQALLRLFQNEWREVFSTMLGHEVRDAATATNAGRNAWAHVAPGADCPKDITRRALLGGAELLDAIKAPNAREARQLAEDALVALREPSAVVAAKPTQKADAQPSSRTTLTLKGETSKPAPSANLTLDLDVGQGVQGLEPWFRIAPPRDDITAGRLTLDHFAANLAAAPMAIRTSSSVRPTSPAACALCWRTAPSGWPASAGHPSSACRPTSAAARPTPCWRCCTCAARPIPGPCPV